MSYRFLEEEFHDHDHDEDMTEEEDHLSDGKPWGPVIGAALLVQTITLSGLLLIAVSRCFGNKKGFWTFLHEHLIPSFAAGALLATTVFLLIPEGFELLTGGHGDAHEEEYEDGHEDHDDHEGHDHRYLEEDAHDDGEQYHWRFGVAFLAGFLIPILLGALFPTPDISDCEQCRQRDLLEEGLAAIKEEEENEMEEVNDFASVGDDNETSMDSAKDCASCSCADGHAASTLKDEEGPVKGSKNKTEVEVTTVAAHPRNVSLAGSICLGDFLHNFCDGIFIGTSFLLCSSDLAWTITVTTIYHELAQEIADFGLLTHHCGLSNLEALVLNFLAGFSVVIGALIVLIVELSETAVGAILVMSSGVYVYIAASECIPRIQTSRMSPRDTLTFLLCFVLGAVPIGLVLLNHGHCDEHGHDEH